MLVPEKASRAARGRVKKAWERVREAKEKAEKEVGFRLELCHSVESRSG